MFLTQFKNFTVILAPMLQIIEGSDLFLRRRLFAPSIQSTSSALRGAFWLRKKHPLDGALVNPLSSKTSRLGCNKNLIKHSVAVFALCSFILLLEKRIRL